MNKYLAIRDDIKTRLEAVPNRGIVHGRSRLATDWAIYIARFKDPSDGRIRGWEICRIAVPEHRRGAIARHHRFVLRGVLGFSDADATADSFQELIEEVCNAFRDAADGASWQFINGDNPDQSPAQVSVIDERMFGNVLCHYCEIHLSVTERINL